ncbi:MAG: bifunctional riboflavin kinase/FAD synthetase, partial [Actinobacteria bacterium]|nr:bifunctional riboflavin kinase/FAD synthetase [Actinomycetota bacterium]
MKKDKPQIKFLTTRDEKIDILRNLGLDRLIVLQFTSALASLSPEEFVRKILIEKLYMKHFIIGHDHAFGRNRTGNFELLFKMSKVHDFKVDAVDPLLLDGQIVSSTKIRNLLADASVTQANTFLGRQYSIRGKVVSGHGRGRDLGFPTANIQPMSENKLVPKIGIYATRVKIDKNVYGSVTYIGNRPTFNLKHKVIEVHITDDFQENLYEKEVELSFVSFIRKDARFDSTEELVYQIEADKQKSLKILTQVKG